MNNKNILIISIVGMFLFGSLKDAHSSPSMDEAKSSQKNAFFESFEKMNDEEQSAAILAWRAKEEKKRLERIKNSAPTEAQTEAQMLEESKVFGKKSLKKQIAILEKEINAAANEKNESRNFSKNTRKTALLNEMSKIQLGRLKSELKAADMSLEKQRENALEWQKTNDALRFREIEKSLREIEIDEQINYLQTAIAKLESGNITKTSALAQDNSLEILNLKLQLAELEFYKNFESIPNESKSQALETHRANTQILRNSINDKAKRLNFK